MALNEQQLREVFVDKNNLLETKDFDRIVKAAHDTRRPLEQMLMERAFVAPHQYLQLLSSYFDVPAIELKISEIDPEVVHEIPENFAERHNVIAFDEDNSTLKVAMVNPDNKEAVKDLQNLTSRKIMYHVTSQTALKRALVLYGGSLLNKVKDIVARLDKSSDSSGIDQNATVELTSAILETAVLMEASDIHIEPYETESILRFRVDGLLRTIATMPPRLHGGITSRLKVMAELKVDQRRLPQDGRFTLDVRGQEVNFRLSTVPSLWAEKAVVRVLPKEAHLFDMSNLGLLEGDLEIIKKHLKQPYGTILVCGPTGSGKTTSLYAFLQEIATDRIDIVNISTIEDPIEYTIPRITQIQTRPDINLTFAAGLRALLRQDPDILMVGEIRDKETADFAVRASLIGRLVLSSLHTNDAPGAIPRLLDMGVEPYLVSSTLSLVVAQRLARKLCNYCRSSYKPDKATMHDLKSSHDLESALVVLAKRGIISKTSAENLRFYKAAGCAHCDNTGYQGRTAVFEILEINEELRNAINERKDSTVLRDIARKHGMKTMFEDGMAKILLGTLDLEELMRVAYSSQIVNS